MLRLLNTATGQFHHSDDPREVRYAILSHVWTKPEDRPYTPEQTYAELSRIHQEAGPGADVLSQLSPKIQEACKVARMDNFEFIWIDTCCIDQTSSAEVSEAINSMYHFYSCSKVCYAYLHDVETGEPPDKGLSQFRRSRWFKRGWTLQELIAPQNVLFLSKDWSIIGTKYSLAATIEEETKIDAAVLKHHRLPSQVPVAQRMGWAARRRTLKEEDRAYCLLGIFGVHLTPIYGEGRNAFVRLQKAILKHDPDQSIFVWGRCVPYAFLHQLSGDDSMPSASALPDLYLLASSPSSFIERPSQISSLSREELSERLGGLSVGYPQYTITSSGIRAAFPIIRYMRSDNVCHWLAILSCADESGNLLALILRPPTAHGQIRSTPRARLIPDTALLVGAGLVGASRRDSPMQSSPGLNGFRLVSLDAQDVEACVASAPGIQADAQVYIKHCPLGPDLSQNTPEVGNMHTMLSFDFYHDIDHSSLQVKLSEWSRNILTSRQGYFVASQLLGAERSCVLELRKGPDTITVTFGHCLCDWGIAKKAFRVEVQPSPPSRGGGPRCEREHVASWSFRNGIASTKYKLKDMSTGELRDLRVSLALGDWPSRESEAEPGSEKRWEARPQFVLDIELIVSSAPGVRSSPACPFSGLFRGAGTDPHSPALDALRKLSMTQESVGHHVEDAWAGRTNDPSPSDRLLALPSSSPTMRFPHPVDARAAAGVPPGELLPALELQIFPEGVDRIAQPYTGNSPWFRGRARLPEEDVWETVARGLGHPALRVPADTPSSTVVAHDHDYNTSPSGSNRRTQSPEPLRVDGYSQYDTPNLTTSTSSTSPLFQTPNHRTYTRQHHPGTHSASGRRLLKTLWDDPPPSVSDRGGHAHHGDQVTHRPDAPADGPPFRMEVVAPTPRLDDSAFAHRVHIQRVPTQTSCEDDFLGKSISVVASRDHSTVQSPRLEQRSSSHGRAQYERHGIAAGPGTEPLGYMEARPVGARSSNKYREFWRRLWPWNR